jgi:hypothetical protein
MGIGGCSQLQSAHAKTTNLLSEKLFSVVGEVTAMTKVIALKFFDY